MCSLKAIFFALAELFFEIGRFAKNRQLCTGQPLPLVDEMCFTAGAGAPVSLCLSTRTLLSLNYQILITVSRIIDACNLISKHITTVVAGAG